MIRNHYIAKVAASSEDKDIFHREKTKYIIELFSPEFVENL